MYITNMYIKRKLENVIEKNLFKRKAIIIYGPRQSGKTTLVKRIVNKINKPTLWLNGDEPDIRILLSDTTSSKLKSIIGNNKIVVIDEAQRIKNIGITIKLIVDNISQVQVIATGSSSFELANEISEPLTGRKFEYLLLPFSFEELIMHHGIIEEKRLIEERLIYGYYPEIVVKTENRKENLKLLSDSYLYKDILNLNGIKKSERLEKLVQALALQIGNEVSFSELGEIVGLDNETVEKYIQLLEKAFIIFRLKSFSRNLRNELKKRNKIYFYDIGIRNAVINNFNTISLRNDIGNLWENFIISERIKFLQFNRIYANQYFWRTHSKQEIDYIEEKEGHIYAYEIKWNPRKKIKFPEKFITTYTPKELKVITQSNFDEFIM